VTIRRRAGRLECVQVAFAKVGAPVRVLPADLLAMEPIPGVMNLSRRSTDPEVTGTIASGVSAVPPMS